MNRFLAWSLGLCLAVALASTTGCMSDCDRVESWIHKDSQVCRECIHANCRTLENEYGRLFFSSTCFGQYVAVNDCPHNRDYCACVDRALTSTPCRPTYYDLLACSTRNCDAQCR